MDFPLTTMIKVYGVTLVAFLAIDLLWLGVIARGFYAEQMGPLMRPEVNWPAALAFYAVFVVGIVVLVVWPAAEGESLSRALILGALFGLVTYAAYDLTNLATLQGFPLKMAVVDLCWGTVLCTMVSFISFKAWMWLA
jgi:uncharacterized membrane protein